jgi:hypothetical protein
METYGEYDGYPIELIEQGLVGGGLYKAGPHLIACTWGVEPTHAAAYVSGVAPETHPKILEIWSDMKEEMAYAIYG